MTKPLMKRRILLLIPVLTMTLNTMSIAHGEEASAEKPKKAAAAKAGPKARTSRAKANACAVSVQPTADRAMEEAGLTESLQVEATSVTGIKIASIEVPMRLAVKDPNAERAARNAKDAKKILRHVLDLDPSDFENFQSETDAIRDSVTKIPELEATLQSSALLTEPLSRMKAADEANLELSTNMQDFVMKVRELNPATNKILNPGKWTRTLDSAAMLGLRSVAKLSALVGKKAAVENLESKGPATKAYEEYLASVLTAKDGIDGTIDLIRTNSTKLKGQITAMKADRIEMLGIEAALEEKIAQLVSLDDVIIDHIEKNTTDTDPVRKYLVEEFLYPIRSVITDYQLTSQQMNDALVQNYANVQRHIELIERSDRAIPRVTIALRVAAGNTMVNAQQRRTQQTLNYIDQSVAELSLQNAQDFAKAGKAMREESTKVNEIITKMEQAADIVEQEVADMDAYKAQAVKAMAGTTKRLGELNDRTRSTVAKMRQGETVRARLAGDSTLEQSAQKVADAGAKIRELAGTLGTARQVAEQAMEQVRRPNKSDK